MGAEQIAGLVDFGPIGAVIAIVVIFLKFIEKSNTTAKQSYDVRDRLWREFFTNLTAGNIEQAQNVNKVLEDLVKTVASLKDEVNGLRSELYLHDARVDRIVEVVKDPRGTADSMLPGRKKKETQNEV